MSMSEDKVHMLLLSENILWKKTFQDVAQETEENRGGGGYIQWLYKPNEMIVWRVPPFDTTA